VRFAEEDRLREKEAKECLAKPVVTDIA